MDFIKKETYKEIIEKEKERYASEMSQMEMRPSRGVDPLNLS